MKIFKYKMIQIVSNIGDGVFEMIIALVSWQKPSLQQSFYMIFSRRVLLSP